MTELIWDGKYDEQRRRVPPPRIALPFQTVETINESAADRDRNLEMFLAGRANGWRNRLIWGDKKYVLPSLLNEFAGAINLVYIDPPFATGGDFSFLATLPADPDEASSGISFLKKPSVIEQKAYRDTWGRGLDGYMQWFAETAALLRELLTENGSLYVHVDWHVSHYAKVVLDEVFGPDSFQNEIIWQRTSAHSDTHRYGMNFDSILFYSKTESFTWNVLYHEYTEKQRSKYRSDDEGRAFADFDLTGAGTRKGATGRPWRGYDPNTLGRHWGYEPTKLDELDKQGRIYWPSRGGFPRLKKYLDEMKGVPLQSLWTDIPPINSQAQERLDYATQKPEALLERIIRVSSNDDDLVLDCFCGSGTTAAVAERLGRRWITCDLGRFAVHTSRKRLLGIANLRPFVVQNLGKYERQAWQVAEFGDAAEAATSRYRQFVLELYHAQPVTGFMWLHGIKSGRMIHIGGVDAPVTRADIAAIATEFRKGIGSGEDAPSRSGIDVLGWDFAFELNETAKQEADLAGIKLRLVRIPRELLEKKAVEQGDVKFFELAALGVDISKKGKKVTLKLTDFIIPLDDVPEDVRKAVTHWEQWVDYWAVDWDNSDDTFHNQWQSYRTRKESVLARESSHTYSQSGKYRIVVKVIDILGNDTTKVLSIEVK